MDSQVGLGISQFFTNRSILITGGTGYLGKGLIEKLLRSCPQIKNIFVLIRSGKDGQSVQSRLDILLKDDIFDRIKQECSQVLTKIIAVQGDLAEDALGLSVEDEEILVNEVSVVIHSGATVRFHEKLKVAVNINVKGTQRVTRLCKMMRQLASFVYLSTAYSNCDREVIDEVIYELKRDGERLVKCLDYMEDNMEELVTPILVDRRPNTYTFTKAMAEKMVSLEADKLPLCIVRPSIVTPTWQEPFPGWVDNYGGITGLMTGVGKGVLRFLRCDADCKADFIPLDVVVNMTLSAAWQTAQTNEFKIYNCVRGGDNMVTNGDLGKYIVKYARKYPSATALWFPTLTFTTDPLIFDFLFFLMHYPLAWFTDAIFRLTGSKPVTLRVYKKLRKVVDSDLHFTMNEWKFKKENVKNLWKLLSPEDKLQFNFNLESQHWPSYVDSYCYGMKKFLWKEDMSRNNKDTSRLVWFAAAHYTFQLVGIVLASYLLLYIVYQL